MTSSPGSGRVPGRAASPNLVWGGEGAAVLRCGGGRGRRDCGRSLGCPLENCVVGGMPRTQVCGLTKRP